MSSPVVVGVDVGTTSVEAVVVGGEGILATAASDPLTLSAPRPGHAVQDVDELRRALATCLDRLLADTTSAPEIAGVCVAAQSGSLVRHDHRDHPLPEIVTWMDTRCAPLVDRWETDGTAATIRLLTGWTPHPGTLLPQIAWMRRTSPRDWDATGTVGSVDDHVVWLLTGTRTTNPSNAAATLLLDVDTADWNTRLCDLAGVDPAMLPDIATPGAPTGIVAGPLTPDVPALSGATVVAGGHDQSCTLSAIGHHRRGRALLAVGTAWVLTVAVDGAVPRPPPRGLNVGYAATGTGRTLSRYLGGFGAQLAWCRRHTGSAVPTDPPLPADDDPHFLPRPTAGHPGSGLLVDPAGAPVDTHAHAAVLAVMEHAAHAVRRALDELDPTHRPHTLVLVGGGTRSTAWPQLVADATGLTVEVPPPRPWPALGAALIASREVLGRDATPEPADIAEHFEPRPEAAAVLQRRRPVHHELLEDNAR